LSVWQNLWVAQNGNAAGDTGFFVRWFGGSHHAKASVEELLAFSDLSNRADDLAGNLAFGEQRRLELARALASKPKLILLDEPAAGMNLEEIRQLDERLKKLKEAGVTILLVEHVMELVMGVTDRIAVLNFGQKIAEGTPSEVRNNDEVKAAYLGGGTTRAAQQAEASGA
jgi:ABC-type branched-subunit amino acid transport system ATPase component